MLLLLAFGRFPHHSCCWCQLHPGFHTSPYKRTRSETESGMCLVNAFHRFTVYVCTFVAAILKSATSNFSNTARYTVYTHAAVAHTHTHTFDAFPLIFRKFVLDVRRLYVRRVHNFLIHSGKHIQRSNIVYLPVVAYIVPSI